jgi:hypothetical protein
MYKWIISWLGRKVSEVQGDGLLTLNLWENLLGNKEKLSYSKKMDN